MVLAELCMSMSAGCRTPGLALGVSAVYMGKVKVTLGQAPLGSQDSKQLVCLSAFVQTF